MTTHPHDHHHAHGHVHLGEAEWAAMADHAEQEGEVLLAYVTDAAARVAELRGPDAAPVRRVLDIGSGPGVGTCELARAFPDAEVVAVDGSPAMLERVARRAGAAGLDGRVATHRAELPDGLDGLGPADVIWASMSLHHVGDEVGALRLLRDLLTTTGLLAVAEVGEPTRTLPTDLDVGRPGLVERLDRVEADWFATMRADLPGSAGSADVATMVAAAGFEVVDDRLARVRLDPPLDPAARAWVAGRIGRVRHRLDDRLDADDLATLDVLADPDDPRGVAHRPDVFADTSRRIVIARPAT